MAPLLAEFIQPSVSGVPWIQALAKDTPVELLEPLVSGVPWIQALKAGRPVESIQSTAAGVPWIQALKANAPLDHLTKPTPSWSSSLLNKSNTAIPDTFTSLNIIEDHHTGTLIALITCMSLYVSLVLVFGMVATYWHYISNGPGCKNKRRLLWFPWYLSIGVFIIPVLAIWGMVQVLVASGLLIIKLVSGREVRRMDRVFSVPPLWRPGGLFKTKPERMNCLPRPVGALPPPKYTRQSLTGGRNTSCANSRASFDLTASPARRMPPQPGPADNAQLVRIPLRVRLGTENPLNTARLSRLERQQEQV